MKYLPLIAILFGYVHSQTEYVPTVPDYIAGIFAVIGTECTTDSECEMAYEGPANFDKGDNASWSCVTEDVLNGDEVTSISVCVFDGCDTNNDCDAGNMCWPIGQCNPYDNTIYPDSLGVDSGLCVTSVICNEAATPLQMEGEWTNDTMCYTGEDGETYVSMEYAVMCGGENYAGTCIADADFCIDPFPVTTDNDASKCVDDETCCTKDGWDEEGCLELLITVYLMYTIIVAVVICLCCVGCCCCIYKKKKAGQNASFENDMDNQTNHYNVYI